MSSFIPLIVPAIKKHLENNNPRGVIAAQVDAGSSLRHIKGFGSEKDYLSALETLHITEADGYIFRAAYTDVETALCHKQSIDEALDDIIKRPEIFNLFISIATRQVESFSCGKVCALLKTIDVDHFIQTFKTIDVDRFGRT